MDIVALCPGLHPHWTVTTLRPCSRIAWAMLVLTGRVTRLGISRWAGKGGRYRPVPRFFSQALPWAMLFGVFLRQHGSRAGEVSLLVGDEGVATTAGPHPHGRDRFFARLDGKPGPGLACFALSWVSLQQRRSCPIRVEQVVRRDAAKAASQAKAAAQQQTPATAHRRPGRPQGSQNPPKADVTLTPA
jgi:putative transposase